MQIAPFFAATATRNRPIGSVLLAATLAVSLAGCAELGFQPGPGGQGSSATAAAASGSSRPAGAPVAAQPTAQPAATQVAAAPPPALPPILPFEQAVTNAANTLFSGAKLPEGAAGGKYTLVIDPLVDGVTGSQSRATRSMGDRIVSIVRERYPQFDVQPLSTESISRQPLVLVGTFTPVDGENKTVGSREAYRICLVLADLRSGRTVGKGVARARLDGVDATPVSFFQESPAWTKDPHSEAYIQTCQGTRPGDPINPRYLDGILASALLAEAIDAYDAGRYEQALGLYQSALQTNGGDQLRAYNGIYLANWKLGRRAEAEQAFSQLVEYGLRNSRLAVKFLFKPGSTAFVPEPDISEPYVFWLRQIARESADANACLEVAGHTSPTGPAPLNERLSLLRAEFVKARLEDQIPQLSPRMIAAGVGSRENLVGTGRDDATDALDRRVEFKVIPKC